MIVFREAVVAEFAARHSASRSALGRFLRLARAADWPHFLAVKRTFPATDYAPATGMLIFNVGGNEYRVVARVNFEKQSIVIDRVLTHEEYNRERL